MTLSWPVPKMKRPPSVLAQVAAAVALGCLGLVPASGAVASTSGRVPLPNPVPDWTSGFSGTPAGASLTMPIRVYLAGRSPAAETAFVTAASTPGNTAYGKYLTPAQFQSRFGPSTAQVAAVKAWARSQGLRVTGSTPNYVALTGTAPAVNTALDTTIYSYSDSTTGFTGYAPVKGASVPASIAADITTVVGLDYFRFKTTSQAAAAAKRSGAPAATAPAVRASFACSSWWGQQVSSIPKAEGHTSAPDAVCGYTPEQLRSAYGVGPGDGKGATIAVVLDGSLTSMETDANHFFSTHHLPGFAPGQFTVNTGPGFKHSCRGGQANLPEEPLDVETLHAIAPQAKIVYVAANCELGDSPEQEKAFLDAETRIVDQHLADVETDSYSIAECAYTPAMAAAWSQIMKRGAAEGIGFNFDSGDGGDNAGSCGGNAPAVAFPASDPWASAVGGTTLEIGKSGTAVGELGWGDDSAQENKAGTGYRQKPPGSFEEGSTGGRSALFAEPAYQHGVVPSSLATKGGKLPADRVVPDVAADASPVTGWLIGYTVPGGKYQQVLEGGTSGAAPIVAALEADAKTPAGHAIGFANPLLYSLRHSAGILDVRQPTPPAVALAPSCFVVPAGKVQLCLITLGLDSSLRVTPGYDDVTGVGAPTSRFIAAAAKG